MAIAKLHNFTIMESTEDPDKTFTRLYGDTVYNASVPNRKGRGPEAPVTDREDRQLHQRSAVSSIRDMMVVRIPFRDPVREISVSTCLIPRYLPKPAFPNLQSSWTLFIVC